MYGVLMMASCVNLDEQRHGYRSLDDWFQTAVGQHVTNALAEPLKRAHLSGDVLLQLGLCGENALLGVPRFKQIYSATPCVDLTRASLITALNALPIQQHQVDCVFAPLLTELFGLHKSPLDEIDRVLRPMGHVVLLGINPLSLWGLAACMQRLSGFRGVSLHLHTHLRVKRALEARGYQLKSLETCYYVPPFRSERLIKQCLFLNEMGKMMALFPAGFYCLIMQKYTPSMLDVAQRTRRVPLLLPS